MKKTNKQTNKWEQNKQRNELKQKQQQQQQRDEFVSQPAARIISTSSPFNIYFNKLIFCLFLLGQSDSVSDTETPLNEPLSIRPLFFLLNRRSQEIDKKV